MAKRAKKKDPKKKAVVDRDPTDGDTAPGGADDLAVKVDETTAVETVVEVVEPGVEEFDPAVDEYVEVARTVIPTHSTVAAARKAQLAPTVMKRVSRVPADVRFKSRRERIKRRRARREICQGGVRH